MLESQPPIRFSEQLLGAEAQRNNTIFNNNFVSSELPSFAGDNYIQNNIEIK